jgi:ABC-type antimicrobial peptide transport system permease subunit
VVSSFHDAIAECVVFSFIVQFQECVVFIFMMRLQNYHGPFSVFMMQIAESVGFLLYDAIFSLLIGFAAPALAAFMCLLLLDESK